VAERLRIVLAVDSCAYGELGGLSELRVNREHAPEQDRFDAIVDWIVDRVSIGTEESPN
jgi:hypothetical protein